MTKRGFITTTGVAGALALTGVATGAIPSLNGGLITTCYDSSGIVKVIDREAGATCPSGSTQLQWNQQGRTGPTGPRGMQGEPGPNRLHSIRVNADGTKKWASRSDITTYDSGTGHTWVYFPGFKLNSCVAQVTPVGNGSPGLTAERDGYAYEEWIYVSTFRNGAAVDIPFDLSVHC
jgi:hypothetical protein